MTGSPLRRLLDALRDPAVYPHPVDDVVEIETHVSHVLLAGDRAYKLKKPLDLGFLDYSTLALRRDMCREELRRNGVLAPGLYEAVVAITGTASAPRLADDPPPPGEPAIEYAVRMRRFPQEAQLDRRLAAGALDSGDMERIAECVALYQAAAPRADAGGEHGTPACVWRPVGENFAQILPRLEEPGLRERVAALRAWSESEHARLEPLLRARLAGGFVRACHGDLHLSNLAEVDGRVLAFDCIEFDPHLWWIDVVSDTAFLVMDLLSRDRRDLAAAFLDAWLARTGDHEGLRLLRYHLAYRSMVRAKVAAIALGQRPGAPAAVQREKLLRHVALAERVAREPRGGVVILCGLAGSGKSTVARALVRRHGALSVRSDVERKRLFGLAATATSGSPLDGGIYTPEANRRTFERLERAVRDIVASGHVAVADACFLRRTERDRFRAVAHELGVPAVVLHLDAATDELLRRVRARAAEGGDASEAGPEVLLRQIATAELPPGPDENALTVRAGDETADAFARRAAAAAAAALQAPPS